MDPLVSKEGHRELCYADLPSFVLSIFQYTLVPCSFESMLKLFLGW